MLNHKEANLVSFTGSTPVGRKIGKLAGEELKDVALELGGNGPFCVMNDADIDNAVDAAIYGKYLHQGQICMITNRIDRKSTRLNSSHVAISYAVFCLKKKKK